MVEEGSFLPALLSSIGSRNNFHVQKAHNGSNKVTFLWKVM